MSIDTIVNSFVVLAYSIQRKQKNMNSLVHKEFFDMWDEIKILKIKHLEIATQILRYMEENNKKKINFDGGSITNFSHSIKIKLRRGHYKNQLNLK
jgi:hypothetical protein